MKFLGRMNNQLKKWIGGWAARNIVVFIHSIELGPTTELLGF